MGKTVTRARDTAGFISNRILMPYINEAVQCLFEGVGTVEDIDQTMKLGCNVPSFVCTDSFHQWFTMHLSSQWDL